MRKEIRIIGSKNSGKTTLIEKLSRELKSRGFRIAAVKHTSHEHEFDRPDTDSWRFRQAGCETAVILSPDKFVCHSGNIDSRERSELFEIIFKDIDILFFEGQGEGDITSIACAESNDDFIDGGNESLIAVVSDNDIVTVLPIFGRNNTPELVDFLIEKLDITRSV